MYADDLVLISPSSAGLSQLLNECEKFGTRHDLKYNANGIILHVVASYNYFGHYITDDLSDDDDINRQRRFCVIPPELCCIHR